MTSCLKLSEIASARSGDKGNHANIGVVARSPESFQFLRKTLTSEWMLNYFRYLGVSHVERFELPKVWAMNFVLYDALAGGASQSLRLDTQGKLLGPALMDSELTVDDIDGALLRSGGWQPTAGTKSHAPNPMLQIPNSKQISNPKSQM